MPIRITGMNSGLDTDSIVQELVSAYKTKSESYEKKKTKLEWTQDAWKDMNTKIYSFYSKKLSNLRFGANFSGKKKTTVSDTSKATVVASGSVINGTQTLKINKLATAGYLTGAEITDKDGGEVKGSSTLESLGIENDTTLKLKVGNEEKEITVTKDMKVSEFVAKLKENGVTASFDVKQKRFFLTSTETGEGNDFEFLLNDAASFGVLDKLGLVTKENYKTANPGITDAEIEEKIKNGELTFAAKKDASSAEIELNGATFTSDTNEFSINGLNITATGETDTEMTITTATDVDGIYNMIKDFIKEYNELTKALETAYNATSSKGYEPLTDDEKSEMSDDEIEKWEKKIKDSLLRRDDTVSSILSSMSMAMNKTYEVNGKKYGLSSFGISTAGYFNRVENESYSYHIDGDPDDASTEGKADKLKSAIAEDPDAVMGFFTELAKGVYNQLDSRMKTTTLSSAYTVYNDKQMKNEIKEQEEMIDKWKEKLEKLEEQYYKQFSAMETALAKLQSQTTSLTSLLGG